MRDNNYVYYQKNKNDWLWQLEERKLYYSYKNENLIIPTILLCLFMLILKGGIIGVIFIIIIVKYICIFNNNELDNDIEVIKQRENIKYYRRTYLKENI